MLADGPIGVVAQPLGIGDGDQEQVESPRAMIAITEPMLTNELVIDPTKVRRNLPRPIGTEKFFVCHTLRFG